MPTKKVVKDVLKGGEMLELSVGILKFALANK